MACRNASHFILCGLAPARRWRAHCHPMRRSNSRSAECLDAVALSRDPYRLHAAPDRELVTAAAVLAKGLVSVIDGGGLRAQRASALDLLDSAGRAIGDELRRRN